MTHDQEVAAQNERARVTMITSEEIKFLFDSWPRTKKSLWHKLLWWR